MVQVSNSSDEDEHKVSKLLTVCHEYSTQRTKEVSDCFPDFIYHLAYPGVHCCGKFKSKSSSDRNVGDEQGERRMVGSRCVEVDKHTSKEDQFPAFRSFYWQIKTQYRLKKCFVDWTVNDVSLLSLPRNDKNAIRKKINCLEFYSEGLG
jgi:hypothetical protein